MLNKKTTFPTLALLRVASFALAAGCGLASAVTTEPAQSPLLSRVSNPPNPNVMIDIDDSGSMQAQYMPEGTVRIKMSNPAWNLPALGTLGSFCDIIDVFYGDMQKRQYSCTPMPAGISYAVPGNNDGVSDLFQRWMRSSDVNSIFYNPAVLYQPWQYVDGSGNITRKPAGVYTAAYWNPASTALGTVDLSKTLSLKTNYCSKPGSCVNKTITYDPGLFYVLSNDGKDPVTYTADPYKISSFLEYDLNGSASSFPAAKGRICKTAVGSGCCTSTGCTKVQEQQNFANWFVYYRTRAHLMKGSLSEALPGALNKVRVAWGTINTDPLTIDGLATTGVVKSGMRDLTTAQLSTILSGIQSIDPYNGTPLREATIQVGDYFSRTDKGSPWANLPGTDAKVSSCRRSYHLLTTDGYYSGGSISVGDVDSNDGATDYKNANPLGGPPNGPAGITKYYAAYPYKDGQSNMLADVAMKYYIDDLQTSVPNRVTPNDAIGDIAFWQHLSMFTVGLGVQGTLNPATDLPALTLGPKAPGGKGWGTDKIDDLWHAAVNTHGAFFSAKDSVTLAQSLTTALGAATSSTRNESGASTSSASLTTATYEYLPVYHSVQWTGDLSAYLLDPKTGARAKDAAWSATKAMPSYDKRNVWTWDTSKSVAFDTAMSSTMKNLVTTTTADQDGLINYLRGDPSNESASGYRARVRDPGVTGVLGDFLGSPPTLVQNFVDLNYDGITGAPNYRTYYDTKSARAYGVIFEGSNDGMLHAFKSTNGAEVYAYVPHAVMGNLATLADQDYGLSGNFHRDFVDGPQTETDAFISTKRKPTASWANLVLGSYGAGAPGFYALDTTDITTFDDKTLLWETGSDNDIGYIFESIPVGPLPAAPVQTGGLANGSWKAFVGNGAYSASGNAVLLIVDVQTGKIDKKITLDSSGNNGLMGVTLLRDKNNAVYAAYAGDLKGNLYRIEFTGTNAPVESFNQRPLFKALSSAGVAQPITAAPVVYKNPAGGTMVLFGTGRLIDATDADSTAQQTFYGIWDKTPSGSSAETQTSPFAAGGQRSLLQAQVISAQSAGVYNVTGTSMDPAKFGWYMDLDPVSTTQRVLYPAQVVGYGVLINTVSPAPLNSDPCLQNSGNSTFFLVGAADGAASTTPTWDIDGNGVIDAGDGTAAGYTTSGAGQNTVVTIPGSSPQQFLNVTAGGNKLGQGMCPGGVCPAGGKHKHQRVWQQLMTPPF